MTMPDSTLVYDVSSHPVVAHGFSFSNQQLEQILAGPVKDILCDISGKQELNELLAGLVTTDFEQIELAEVLAEEYEFEDWLVGEAIAEAFVAKRGRCEYPWPTSRDLKNSNASPAGCDLTGLQLLDDQELPYRFSFGEVKTSYDQNSPPSVMTSLGNQLFGLRDDKGVKNDLVKYLGLHATGKPWQFKFQSAAKRYVQSQGTDIAVYGVLVRDTEPREADIRGRARALSVDCPPETDIELHAIHIPTGEITNLPARAQSAMNNDEGEA
ncbi:hypothetical protein [Vibrio parahaemolyticus]|uniref:hypothetical protein n=1 Tax=Vibrio parahaemolyticus TaxID=670 RepID=UPI0004157CE9|nr:hypothetical protein [Vibrio parahaemolyticus]EJE4156354.1 hypothetical protein [Vibrio parahaemolyticus]KJR16210.1 hypothetical protein UF28_10225 [Vibrio parahaemolyticus]HBC3817659.1 hypothetical protein [Vibrio parahaemolyticus]